MSEQEKMELNISQLPSILFLALGALKADPVMADALGEHIFKHFLRAKYGIWREYCAQVHQWELEQYLGAY